MPQQVAQRALREAPRTPAPTTAATTTTTTMIDDDDDDDDDSRKICFLKRKKGGLSMANEVHAQQRGSERVRVRVRNC
jgi:hypothetical protein